MFLLLLVRILLLLSFVFIILIFLCTQKPPSDQDSNYDEIGLQHYWWRRRRIRTLDEGWDPGGRRIWYQEEATGFPCSGFGYYQFPDWPSYQYAPFRCPNEQGTHGGTTLRQFDERNVAAGIKQLVWSYGWEGARLVLGGSCLVLDEYWVPWGLWLCPWMLGKILLWRRLHTILQEATWFYCKSTPWSPSIDLVATNQDKQLLLKLLSLKILSISARLLMIL